MYDNNNNVWFLFVFVVYTSQWINYNRIVLLSSNEILDWKTIHLAYYIQVYTLYLGT